MTGDAREPIKEEAATMQEIEAGCVIADQYGNQMVVEEVTRNPQYDRDGVPCSVKCRSREGVSDLITFGPVGEGQPFEDWRNFKVVSKPDIHDDYFQRLKEENER